MNYLISALFGLVFGFIGSFLFCRIKFSKSKRRKAECKTLEFSKLILSCVMLTYFMGVGIGAYVVVWVSVDQLGVLLTYIGTPAVTAIGFYAWKSKAENTIKLKKQYPNETGDVYVDLNNIQP